MAAPLTQEKFVDSTGVCQILGEVMEHIGEPGLSCFGHAIPQVASGVKLRHAPAGCFGFDGFAPFFVFADGGPSSCAFLRP